MLTSSQLRSFVITLVAMLGVVVVSSPLQAQDTKSPNTDLKFHKFVPVTAPENNASAKAALQATTNDDKNSATMQQMQLLLQEKASRTPAQQKIDSNVLYTIRMMRGQEAAPGVTSLYTGVDLDQDNRIVVDMVADATDQLLQQLQAAGALVLDSHPEYRSIRALIPPDQIEAIATSSDVSFIGRRMNAITAGSLRALRAGTSSKAPARAPGFAGRAARIRKQLSAFLQQRSATNTAGVINTGQGSVTTEGDATHLAARARGVFGVNGSGLKIGVLSDSANNTGALNTAQATGDMPPTCPGPGGPCLTILQDFFGGNGSDEGTAMMEIIYDMAPGASLFFATAANSESSFAANIQALRTAGCDIIVDDIFYPDEPVFQDGVVAQAVNTVTASGALYFSSAGNEGNVDAGTGGYFEGDFNDAGSPTFPNGAKAGTIHNFGAGLLGDLILSPGGLYVLQWADPFNSPTDDYDLFYVNSAGIVQASSTNTQNGLGGQIAAEFVDPPNNAGPGDRLVVFKTTAASARLFALKTLRGELSVATAGETWGHSAASAAFSVAAAPAAGAFASGSPAGPFPNPFTTASQLETFTSDGPRRIIFNADGTPITPGNFSSTGGTVRNKPDITAADGVSTTFPFTSGLNPFYGTSAAAPSAASVAALVKSASPSLTPAQIRTTLTSTALDIAAPGIDRDSGNGIVMAFPALNSLGLTPAANPEIGAITATENPGNGNGIIEPGEGAALTIQLKNAFGVANATGITAVLTTITPGVTITQPATSAYPDLPAGTGVGNNITPFTFTVATNAGCSLNIEFKLTLTYTGGPAATKTLNFSVQTGVYTITNSLGSTPASLPPGVTFATGVQTNRISRNGLALSCGFSKGFPGAIPAGNRTFDSYTLTTTQSACLKTQLTSPDGSDLFESVYSPSYVPSSINLNYVGDAGLSGSPQGFSVSTNAAQSVTLVVNDSSTSGTAVGTNYTVQIPSCVLTNPTNVNHPPVAVAQDVTVFSATPGGTADATIDNGSFDPDGGSITLTQSPSGPYPHGTTTVLLTVVDPLGATSQATAIVTVRDPGPDLEITKTHSGTFAQGQTGAVYTITIRNKGTAPTNGTVTMTDMLPSSLTATNIAGTGWACTVASVTCTRTDVLANGSSYPPITLTVTVSFTAPANVVNQAVVSGGGATNVQALAADPTIIFPEPPDMFLVKSHTGNFNVGQVGATYAITVNNIGGGPTNAPVTVVDTLPVGLTATAISGTGWTCTLGNLTCTRSDALSAFVNYPDITVTVNVTATAPTTVTNKATVSGGGENNLLNDVANDQTTIVAVIPDLTITKTHTGNFTAGQIGATYTIAVTNSGLASTTGTVTVVDTLPAGLTATAMSGTGWTCTVGTATCTRSDALAVSTSYPPITITVNVGTSVLGLVINTATVSGGGETNTANDTANDRTTVDAVDLVVQLTTFNSFKQGQGGAIVDVQVINQGTLPTTAPITVADVLPAGLTATAIAAGPFDVGGWSCTLATLSCTTTNSLNSGHVTDIQITVTVAANAPATVTDSATVSGGGETNTANDTVTLPIAVQLTADLSITSSHTGNFTQGQMGATYTITVSNVGQGDSFQAVTVSDALPAGLTATSFSDPTGTAPWICTLAPLTCTTTFDLRPGLSFPLTLKVNVAANAPSSVINTVTVSGGGEVNAANDVSNDPTTINPATTPPDMTVTSTHVGNFSQGQIGAVFTLTANNIGSVSTTGTVNVVDSLPSGLTATAISGTGWTCTLGTLTCTRADALAGVSSYPPITLTVNVAGGIPANVTNSVTVSGGGETITTNDTSADPTTILSPDLTISMTNSNFSQGEIGATYVITINNVGGASTNSLVTFVDTLPQELSATSMTGAGWTCNVSTFTCTRSDVLAAASSYPAITLTVNVANNAPGQVTSVAVVSGGGENNLANDTFTIHTFVSSSPDLVMTLDHAGNFSQSQVGAIYHLTVSNFGQGPTVGTVTVVDTLPASLTATAMSGTGWACTLGTLTCTRGDLLGIATAYPTIALTVNVASNAPASITNMATVSGGGENNPANDAANDVTTVTGLVADLTITKTHSGNFVQGGSALAGATYTITVSNNGAGPTTLGSNVTVVDTLPSTLTATGMLGTGWTCTVATLTCVEHDQLTVGASYPPITLSVLVGATAPASVTNTATVSGGGEVNTANDTASDVTAITQLADLTIGASIPLPGFFLKGQTGAQFSFNVTNSGNGPTSGTVTVVGSLPPDLTATAIAGTGWSCTLATTTCTRSDVLAAGTSYPGILVTMNVSATAAASVSTTVAVSGGGEIIVNNDSLTFNTTITTPPAVSLSATSLTFTNQGVNTTSAAKQIVVTNSGGQTLTFTAISATLLSNPTNWAIAPGTTCVNGVLVAAGGQCVINVTFAPTVVGNVGPDTLTLNDTGVPGPQIITLSGTGIDFSEGGPTAPVSISAGQTANFTITLTPGAGGFANAVSFSASGLPSASSPSFNPASVTPGSTATSTTFSIATTARGALPPFNGRRPWSPIQLMLWALAFTSIALVCLCFRTNRPRRFAPAIVTAAVFVVAIVITGCGSAGGPPPPTGTPAGTYPIMVTATSGSLVHSTTVTLTVQ